MDGIFLPIDYAPKYFFSVTENTFKGCWRGIWANESFAFHICRNNFMDSYPTYCEGPDAGRRSWNNSHEGNYWATYNGSDSNHDGIGDLQFNRVPGGGICNADYYPLMVPWTPPDIAVRDATTSKTIIGHGYTGLVNVTLENQGNKVETFNTTVFANSTFAYSESSMLAMTNHTLSFVWNTTGFAYGNYTINACAEPLLEELDISDNNCTCSFTVHVGVPGDVSSVILGVYDGRVDMRDIMYLIIHFGTTPTSPNWNPNCDINNDGTVNMRDIQIAILNFNKHE